MKNWWLNRAVQKEIQKLDSGGTLKVKESNKTYSDIICCHGIEDPCHSQHEALQEIIFHLYFYQIFGSIPLRSRCASSFSPKSLLRTWLSPAPSKKSGLRVQILQPDYSDCSFSLGLTFYFPLSSNCLLQVLKDYLTINVLFISHQKFCMKQRVMKKYNNLCYSFND